MLPPTQFQSPIGEFEFGYHFNHTHLPTPSIPSVKSESIATTECQKEYEELEEDEEVDEDDIIEDDANDTDYYVYVHHAGARRVSNTANSSDRVTRSKRHGSPNANSCATSTSTASGALNNSQHRQQQRCRLRISSAASLILTKVYERTSYPDTEIRNLLGRKLGMSPRNVQVRKNENMATLDKRASYDFTRFWFLMCSPTRIGMVPKQEAGNEKIGTR